MPDSLGVCLIPSPQYVYLQVLLSITHMSLDSSHAFVLHQGPSGSVQTTGAPGVHPTFGSHTSIPLQKSPSLHVNGVPF